MWLLLQLITDTVTDDAGIYWNITRTRILTYSLAGPSRNDVRIRWNITHTRILTYFLAGASRNDVRIHWNITHTRILTYFLAGASRDDVRIYWNITRTKILTYFLAGASRNDVRIYWNITRTRILTYFFAGMMSEYTETLHALEYWHIFLQGQAGDNCVGQQLLAGSQLPWRCLGCTQLCRPLLRCPAGGDLVGHSEVTWTCSLLLVSVQFSPVQDGIYVLEKPICAPPHLSEVSCW